MERKKTHFAYCPRVAGFFFSLKKLPHSPRHQPLGLISWFTLRDECGGIGGNGGLIKLNSDDKEK